jgi:alpha-glucuronidase
MKLSRREFVATSLGGAAGLCVGGLERHGVAAEAAALPLDEDGYKLWLRYAPPGLSAKNYRKVARQIRVGGASATCAIIRDELGSATSAMLGNAVRLNERGVSDVTLILGTPANSALIGDLNWAADLQALGDEGFVIRSVRIDKNPVTVIAANTEIGTLYGAFHFLRRMQTGQAIDRFDLKERPVLQLRLMNHWDNPDGTIERGYAGRSLWQWSELPGEASRLLGHTLAGVHGIGYLREGPQLDGGQSARWSSATSPPHGNGLGDESGTGHELVWGHFSQANWHAFGRLAWNPNLSAESIADEWTRMTFTNEDKTVIQGRCLSEIQDG